MQASVTVAFVPRETVSTTVGCLQLLIQRTPEVAYVAVVAGYPAEIAVSVRKLIASRGGRVIDLGGHATPNEARNAALAVAETPYIVFIDNDATVAEGWLPPLIACAEETGAAIVAPLVFELSPPFKRIHMAGGEARLVPLPNGGFAYHERHHRSHELMTEPLERSETELVEFHTVLVETAWLKGIGGLDRDLLSFAEHWDMCVLAAAAKRSVYLEPRSHVNYGPPAKLTPEDKRFFELRWSDDWFHRSIEALARKHGIPPGHKSFTAAYHFLARHRRHRYAKLQGRMRRVVGKTLSGIIARRIVQQAIEAIERPGVGRDIREHRVRRDAAARLSASS